MKIKIILVFLLLVSLAGCGSTAMLFHTDKDFERIVDDGNRIIEAIGEYRKINGEYPHEIESLIPKFLDKMPNGGYEEDEDKIAPHYSYLNLNHANPPRDDYEIWFNIDRFVILFPKEARYLVYRPSEVYNTTKWDVVLKKVENWAVVKKYREIN